MPILGIWPVAQNPWRGQGVQSYFSLVFSLTSMWHRLQNMSGKRDVNLQAFKQLVTTCNEAECRHLREQDTKKACAWQCGENADLGVSEERHRGQCSGWLPAAWEGLRQKEVLPPTLKGFSGAVCRSQCGHPPPGEGCRGWCQRDAPSQHAGGWIPGLRPRCAHGAAAAGLGPRVDPGSVIY